MNPQENNNVSESENAGPGDNGPENTEPGDTGPENAGPENAGPENTAPESTAPGDAVPENTGPDETTGRPLTWRDRYQCHVNAEAVDKYGPGLFHPVYLGDVYKEGRYRIEQKLGFGSQATIWGARDLPSNELVALKIFAANLSQNNKELAILQRLRDSTLVHPGREHVVEFLDYFYHDGVNGRHLVIVTKPLKQTLFYYTDNIVRGGRAVGEYTCSAFCRQLLLAVDFLHKCHVVHADLNNSNIMVGSTEAWSSREPWIVKVTRRDGLPLEDGVPESLVGTSLIAEYLREPLSIKIIDFSSSFFDDDYPTWTKVTPCLHPPEMIFKKPLTNAMDIWEVACIIWWVATGDDLFYSRQNNREIIPQIHAFLGSSCADWLLGASIEGIVNEIWTTAPTPVDFDVREMVPLEQELKDLLSDDEDDEYDDFANYTEQLGKFMRRMLVVDPKQRPTAEELLEDEFLREKKTVGA